MVHLQQNSKTFIGVEMRFIEFKTIVFKTNSTFTKTKNKFQDYTLQKTTNFSKTLIFVYFNINYLFD